MQVCELSTLSPMGLSSCSTNSTKLTLLLSSQAILHMSEEVSVTLALSPPQLTWPQPTGLNEFYSPLTTITFARSLCCPVVHWKTLNGSDSMVLPSEAHVQFQPKPDWLHLSTKAVQSIYWNRDSE